MNVMNEELNMAQEVLRQIQDHYMNDYINRADIARHLQNDRIDGGVPTVHKHSGFSVPYSDNTPCVIHYRDHSLLIVTHKIIAAQEAP